MAETSPLPRATSTRVSITFFGCAAAALFAFPLIAGWNVMHAFGSGAFVVAFIFVPGHACLTWIDDGRDWITHCFLAFVVGLALLTVVFLALAVFDARACVWVVPLLGSIGSIAARGRTRAKARPTTTMFEACAALVTIAAALMRVEVESPTDWFRGFVSDFPFHVENANELSHHWPMTDPRIAGESLRYHFFSYIPTSAASVVLGLPVRECMLGLGAHLVPMMFALGMFVAARALKAGVVAAACASLALVLHADLGTPIGSLFGLDCAFGSYFNVGIFGSVTTAQGLCVFVAIAVVLRDVFENPLRLGPRLFLLALFSALASGSKGSVLPPLLIALAAAWVLRRAHRGVIGWTFVVMALAALPFTAWLTFDPHGYARNMFHLHPVAAQTMSAFHWHVVNFLGGDPAEPSPWVTALLFVPWCVGYFGIGALALWVWFKSRTKPSNVFEIVLLATIVFGFAPAVLYASDGFSQLFFAYDAQVCAVLLGAIATTRVALAARRWYVIAFGALLAVQLAAVGWAKTQDFQTPVQFVGDIACYRRALDWIRAETPHDAVLLIHDQRMSPTTWSERRAFFETRRFLPRVHAEFRVEHAQAKAIDARPFADRERLQDEFFSQPTMENLRAIRAVVGEHVPIFALRARMVVAPRGRSYTCELEPLEDASIFGRAAGLELVHDAGIVAVYRLPD